MLGRYYNDEIPDIEITGISCNTKDVEYGNIFVCIEGSSEDGHKYAQKAYELGAKIIVSSKPLMVSVPVVETNDTKEALCYLTKRYYGVPDLKLFAVTGTNGKTSVSYFSAEILKAAGLKCGIIGTNGVWLGDEEIQINLSTPTTPDMPGLYHILSVMQKHGADCAVMEVSSHALSQNRIDGLSFEAGAFTNLTQDHLDYHKTMEDYFLAKQKLFEVCKTGAVNIDDSYGKRILEKYPHLISYGEREGIVRAENIRYETEGSIFELIIGQSRYVQQIHIPGTFSVYNALASAAMCYAAGISDIAITSGLKNMRGICGRMERISCRGGFDIIIDYAHTPDGLLKVLESIDKIKNGRVICVFGCGGDRDRTKRPIMGKIATEMSDIAVITSDNPRCEPPVEIIIDILTGVVSDNYIVIENRKKAIEAALNMARPGDIVLLAGKGQERYQIIGREKRFFDEREIIEKYIKA